MKCRRSLRKLVQEYNSASPTDKPNTALMKLRQAILGLKSAPSRLAAPHTQASRYDDYVYVHQQSMAGHGGGLGPHPGHRGPTFFPWHRELLRQFEADLRAVSGDSTMCLPYWDWSRDHAPTDAGYPFITDFLGGDGTGPNNIVQTGVFARANGWILHINDDPGEALQRDLGGGSPSLPSRDDVKDSLAVSTYDSAPWNRTSSGSSSFRNMVEGWANGLGMHNQVHVWVGGSMLPSTSPNDPVFFFNHAKEDQLWAVWMQKHPTVPHYLPADSEPLPTGHTHLKRLSDHMDSLAEYFGANTLDRPIDLLNHKAITWYDTDLPEIALESGPALSFSQTPAGLTVAKRIRFRVQTGRSVFFRITGAPTGNFSVVGGPDFSIVPSETNDFEILEIEVRFHAVGASVQVGAIDIEAQIIDEDGYFAANEGDPFTVGRFHIELVASGIVTNNSSLVLVLDRSGSMSDIANSGLAKHELLKGAVGVLHALMQDNDQIGIARFSHEADVLLPMTPKSAGLGSILTGGQLDPWGGTSIAAGVLVGRDLINGPGATHPNKAMVVLTDGNETASPTIDQLPQGTFNQTTFAIGFGLPGQVSDSVLGSISANSGGYQLVTGNMTNDDERFRLAKIFIQILKDATRNQTVVDPPGLLLWKGAPQETQFAVSDADVSVDVVVLCPIPAALDFRLLTPSGRTITPSDAGVEPNIRYITGDDVAYYRLMLPALPGDAGGSHRGTWRAVVRLKTPEEVMRDMRERRGTKRELAEIALKMRELPGPALPYTLTVHTYSNLTMDAALRQSGFAPGATVHVSANLREYQAPLRREARVWAEIRRPDGGKVTMPLALSGEGDYVASFMTVRPGIYEVVVRAEGFSAGSARFMREKMLTAGVWEGGDERHHPKPGAGSGDSTCGLLSCLLQQASMSEALRKRLKELGIDLGALRRCLEAQCGRPTEATPKEARTASLNEQKLTRAPELRRLLATLSAEGIAGEGLLEAAETAPVARQPKRKSSGENMFVLRERAPQKAKPPKGNADKA